MYEHRLSCSTIFAAGNLSMQFKAGRTGNGSKVKLLSDMNIALLTKSRVVWYTMDHNIIAINIILRDYVIQFSTFYPPTHLIKYKLIDWYMEPGAPR